MNRSRIQQLASQSPPWIPYAVFVGALVVAVSAALYVHRVARAQDQARFNNSVKQINTVLESRMDTYVALLRAGTGLFAASQSVEPDEFHKFVSALELQRHYQGVQGIGFSVRLKPDERNQLIEMMRREGNVNFKIWPEGDRPEYDSIIYLEPSDRRNQAAIGYDMFTDPTRRAAMEQARDTGLPAASGRVTLLQEIEEPKQNGLLIYAPVYRNGAPTNTVEQRRAALSGFVYAAFRAGDLLTNILKADEYQGIDFRVFDGEKSDTANLLYDSGKANTIVEASRYHATGTVPIAQRSWTLSFGTNRDFETASATSFAILTLLSGVFLSLLLFAITRSQAQAQVAAVSAARELRHSEKSLRKSLEEQERAEEEVRRSEEKLQLANYRFRVAEEASRSFHYDWNLETDTVARSETLSQVLGYGPDEIADTWEAWKDLVHPDDFQVSKAEAIAYLNQLPDDNLEVEYRVRHKDGRYLDLYNRGIILRDEQGKARRVIGQTVDITEQKLAEETLRKANEQAIVEYERLLERIAALAQALGAELELPPIFHALREFALASVPCDGLFVSLYDAAKDVRTASYGWGDGVEVDVSKLPPMPVTTDGLNSRAVRTGQIVISKDYPKDTLGHASVTVGPDNGLRPQSSMVVPMSVLGRVIGTIEVQSYEPEAYRQTHATAMRMAANLTAVAIENAQLLARESQARAEAEESNRLKDEFLATVSHELRTPLTAILGWAHMLDAGQIEEAAVGRAVQTIVRNAKSQAQIIDDILDVSRIVTGNLSLDLKPTNLAPVVEAAINVVRPLADAKHISIVTNFDAQPAVVFGDAHRLQQIAWNLLSNAIKFTAADGWVQVDVHEIDSHVEVKVSDNGQGISAAFLPHVFERFRQADSSTTRAYGGLGLGLAIVRHLVEIHGGNVNAQSEGRGKGATFTVTLPLLRATDQTDSSERLKETAPAGDPLSLSGVRVLLVDDDPGTLEMISAVLVRSSASVTAVSSVAEAIAVIEVSRPDILVSDIAMPDHDGYELIEKVRALPDGGTGIPAMAITAYAGESDRRRALSAGYQGYLAKPIEPGELVAMIAKLARAGAVAPA